MPCRVQSREGELTHAEHAFKQLLLGAADAEQNEARSFPCYVARRTAQILNDWITLRPGCSEHLAPYDPITHARPAAAPFSPGQHSRS